MFYLIMVDYPVFFPTRFILPWDTFLTLRGTLGYYLKPVLKTRPSESCGWGGGGGGGLVQDFSVSLSPLGPDWNLGLTGLGLGWVLGKACQFS